MLSKSRTRHCLYILVNKHIIIFLLIVNLKSIVHTQNTFEIEQLELNNYLEDIEPQKDLFYVKKDEITPDVFELNNHDIGFDLLACLRLYKFRTEVTFTDEFESLGSIGARLIGPLYRSAYNGDLECVKTLVKEIQTSELLKGNLNHFI